MLRGECKLDSNIASGILVRTKCLLNLRWAMAGEDPQRDESKSGHPCGCCWSSSGWNRGSFGDYRTAQYLLFSDNRGNDELKERRYKNAIRDYTKSLKLYPTGAWALQNRELAFGQVTTRLGFYAPVG